MTTAGKPQPIHTAPQWMRTSHWAGSEGRHPHAYRQDVVARRRDRQQLARRCRNVAVLQGAVAYLESVDVAGVGFYSTGYQWGQITGGSQAFARYPELGCRRRDPPDREATAQGPDSPEVRSS